MTALYVVGSRVTCRGRFVDSSTKALVDPETVTCKVKPPTGAIATYVYGLNPELAKVSVGVYQISIDAEQPGRYYYRFESSGQFKAAQEASFRVKPGVL